MGSEGMHPAVTPGTKSDGAPSAHLKALLHDLRMSRAALLARDRAFDEAERLIGLVLDEEPSHAQALDLLARIRAQRGRVDDAKVLWRQALRADPANRRAHDALQAVEGRTLILWRLRLAGLALAVALIAAVFVLAVARLGGIDRAERRVQTSAPPVPGTMAVFNRKEGATPPLQEIPDLADDTPGIHWHKLESGLLVTFDRDLFVHGTDLSDAARPLLMNVADRLRPHSRLITATVLGCTDKKTLRAGSPFEDNFLLGLARAGKIVEILSTQGHLSGIVFAARSKGNAPDVPGFEDAKFNLDARTAVVRVLFERHRAD